MKRLLTVTVAALALAIPAIVNAAGDAKGPPCSDINGITTNYRNNNDGTFTFAAQVFLGPNGTAAPCQNINYTTYIVTDPNATPIPVVGTIDPVTGALTFGPVTVTDDDTLIQIYSTTDRNGRVLDRAPDSGFLEVDATVTGGRAPYG